MELLKTKKLFLFDLDGTLYLGDRVFDFTGELLSAIRAAGGNYLFMTNNSSRSVADYVDRLRGLGLPAAEEDFVTSTQVTGAYLKAHHPGKRLYVCGTASMKEELRREGLPVTEDPALAQGVVMGYDTELTYQKLRDVCWLLLTRPGIPYLATNPDLVCPTEYGSVPDCGSICACVKNATGREPLVLGKPAPQMVWLAMERMGVSREQTCVVGDRIYTDVKAGLNAGVTGILVLSGETTPAILAASPDKPHLVMKNAGEILDREAPGT